MTSEKVRELSSGLMEDNILENGKLVNNTELELISARMELRDKVSG
jgi:hypothetical protein